MSEINGQIRTRRLVVAISVLFGISLFVIASSIGYNYLTSPIGEPSNPYTRTEYDLLILARVIARVELLGTPIDSFANLDQFISFAYAHEYIWPRMDVDAFGNPFTWECRGEGHVRVVEMFSNGANGVAERGRRDDVAIIIELTNDAEPLVRLLSFGHVKGVWRGDIRVQ